MLGQLPVPAWSWWDQRSLRWRLCLNNIERGNKQKVELKNLPDSEVLSIFQKKARIAGFSIDLE
jgi:hypothetical protein